MANSESLPFKKVIPVHTNMMFTATTERPSWFGWPEISVQMNNAPDMIDVHFKRYRNSSWI